MSLKQSRDRPVPQRMITFIIYTHKVKGILSFPLLWKNARKTLGTLVFCNNTFHIHTFLQLYMGFVLGFHLGCVALSMPLSLFVPFHWHAKICPWLGEGTWLALFPPAGTRIFCSLTLLINFFHCGIYKILSIPCYNRHYMHFHKTFSQHLSEI